jgi:hypothetical protein
MALLLDAFQSLFAGQLYKHRDSSQGDKVAAFLYDDLLALGRSRKLVHRIQHHISVAGQTAKVFGRPGRRPDGTFGALVPAATAKVSSPYLTARGPLARLEIGTEVKIMATKMIAQVDRVLTGLGDQATTLTSQNKAAIRVAIVGVNHAGEYTGWEGDRPFPAKAAPSREAVEIIRRVETRIRPLYDELLILRFSATNRPPYNFSWVNPTQTLHEYNAILLRVSDEYEARF